jgi:hypothetical protein
MHSPGRGRDVGDLAFSEDLADAAAESSAGMVAAKHMAPAPVALSSSARGGARKAAAPTKYTPKSGRKRRALLDDDEEGTFEVIGEAPRKKLLTGVHGR